ncbi:hypothetical protein CWM53_05250 [Klebsiella sp. A-Nf5]|uniref:hypothetical protein n=1 Tax=unclassified Klebsiella TaxID=2608929 RepID=UPI000C2AFFC5|nr:MULTISPECIES: hypothetical protein [unclassified Klebsiella]PJX33401.1 hypothetical protein CWM53_05250 [Klebsiella sp. A-Nf5]PJX35844.1 hypothetical protein CWM59_20590 [Klebsiella sp. B-Nf7]PJX46430.1 hypothetical protein CWM60_21340 [Klebsiella sp. C1-16S-Nf17]
MFVISRRKLSIILYGGVNMKNFILAVLLTLYSLVTPAFSDPYDGEGDTPDHPDMFHEGFETEDGTAAEVVTPGDGQDYDSHVEDGKEVIDFDKDEAPDSDQVELDEPEDQGMQEMDQQDDRGNDDSGGDE